MPSPADSTPPVTATIVLTGGGTGGHIFPALAIADALRARHPHLRILYIGGTDGMEARLVPERNLPFIGLPIAGFQRRLTLRNILRNLTLPFRVLRTLAQAISILRKNQVVGVIGTGGYASLPALLAARMLGIPYVLNEQNAFPGLVTRWMAPAAQRVYLGLSDAAKRLTVRPERLVVSGNPVRAEIGTLSREQARAQLGFAADRPLLAVLGGSLGARTLNSAVSAHVDTLTAAGIQLFWQCGRAYINEISLRHPSGPSLRIEAFVADMPALYAAADLVIARAGALTISELQAAGRPAVLVPSPNVTDDHQTHNARALERAGSALVISDADAPAQLIPQALQLLTSGERLRILSGLAGAAQATLRLSPPAAEQIASDVTSIFGLAHA